MISTIICFYNEINYIKLTLESLRRQNFKNLEIILIDDCSQYGNQLIKICELFKDLKLFTIEIIQILVLLEVEI